MDQSENNIEKAQWRVRSLLHTVKKNMQVMWPTLTLYTQTKFKGFSQQDWRDFAQTLLEATYDEYSALDGYYLPPDEVHAIQVELDKFMTTFSLWFKENFNEKSNEKEEKGD